MSYCATKASAARQASTVIASATRSISTTAAIETVTNFTAASSSDSRENDSGQQIQVTQQESARNLIVPNSLSIISVANADNSSTLNPIIIDSAIATVSHPTKNNMIRAGGGGGGGGKADAKPRGRMTAYAYFVQTCREEHKKKHPDETVIFAEFSRKCAERWKSSSHSTHPHRENHLYCGVKPEIFGFDSTRV
uniref:HMG box domain-containing protein n=1 Tax=Glossina pallidipes TaxID=7398 RepID=A0A1A9ZLQ0_GLOPL